ncbi:hypothetical protein MKX03_015906 [Papaver bracteatum]|nr:hypothetical protein MKX03_015906 [Papaver bracteatum]
MNDTGTNCKCKWKILTEVEKTSQNRFGHLKHISFIMSESRQASTSTATVLNAQRLLLDPPPAAPPPLPLPPPSVPLILFLTQILVEVAQTSHESNDAIREAGKSRMVQQRRQRKRGGSTPVSETIKEKLKTKETKLEKNKKKRNNKRLCSRGEDWEVAESIRWLADVVMRSEQARMETMKEVEKMRLEAEAKKGEMDLKRTEIMANTQLQIAKILASNGKDIDSSLRIGRS